MGQEEQISFSREQVKLIHDALKMTKEYRMGKTVLKEAWEDRLSKAFSVVCTAYFDLSEKVAPMPLTLLQIVLKWWNSEPTELRAMYADSLYKTTAMMEPISWSSMPRHYISDIWWREEGHDLFAEWALIQAQEMSTVDFKSFRDGAKQGCNIEFNAFIENWLEKRLPKTTTDV